MSKETKQIRVCLEGPYAFKYRVVVYTCGWEITYHFDKVGESPPSIGSNRLEGNVDSKIALVEARKALSAMFRE